MVSPAAQSDYDGWSESMVNKCLRRVARAVSPLVLSTNVTAKFLYLLEQPFNAGH
jgi:hypothetical protein